MSDHIPCSHLFFACFYLNLNRSEKELYSENMATDAKLDARGKGLVHEDTDAPLTSDNNVEQRRSVFFIEDNPHLWQASFTSTRRLTQYTTRQQCVTVVTIREQGTAKFAQVLRLMRAVTLNFSKHLYK